jgi:(2Fe-2S) ferredoxin
VLIISSLFLPGGLLVSSLAREGILRPAPRPVRRVTGEEEPVPKPERQVLVCVNSRPPGHPKGSCGEKGSQALFDRLKEILRERGLEGRVMVNRTYCLKHCSRGPVLAVQPDNVWYAGVTAGDLVDICASHLEGGQPVERLLMPDIPWE